VARPRGPFPNLPVHDLVNLKEGRVTRLHNFMDRAAALEAAGLSE
jgi:ketosteroid isomerase-like protein